MEAGCWAARVVAACIVLRDSVVAAWKSVKSIMNTIIWVSVQVADLLSRMMFLKMNVLSFGWIDSGALRGACLLDVVYVVG